MRAAKDAQLLYLDSSVKLRDSEWMAVGLTAVVSSATEVEPEGSGP
jgi:hypothetical protein